MKKSPYSPDEFMTGLYDKIKADPYKDVNDADEVLKVSRGIKEKAKQIFQIDKISHPDKTYLLTKVGQPLDYPDYTLQIFR